VQGRNREGGEGTPLPGGQTPLLSGPQEKLGRAKLASSSCHLPDPESARDSLGVSRLGVGGGGDTGQQEGPLETGGDEVGGRAPEAQVIMCLGE
jgi:hypothetical protein